MSYMIYFYMPDKKSFKPIPSLLVFDAAFRRSSNSNASPLGCFERRFFLSLAVAGDDIGLPAFAIGKDTDVALCRELELTGIGEGRGGRRREGIKADVDVDSGTRAPCDVPS